MTEQYAPAGKIWFCMMCSKTTNDCYGQERGWDESCVMNCILVDETTKQPTEKEASEFSVARAQQMENIKRRMDVLLGRVQDRTGPDPDILKLAEEAIQAVGRRNVTAREDEALRAGYDQSSNVIAVGRLATDAALINAINKENDNG